MFNTCAFYYMKLYGNKNNETETATPPPKYHKIFWKGKAWKQSIQKRG